MSDKQTILDQLKDAIAELDALSSTLDTLRDGVESDVQDPGDRADEIADDIEGDDTENPYGTDDDEAAEHAAWDEGWQAAVDRIRRDYGN